jgi:serine/threonine-protein kinase RsbW
MKPFDAVRLANCHASLSAANAMLLRYCKRYGIDPTIQQNLLLLLEEALVNIINHGFVDNDPHFIEFSIHREPPNTVLRFQDDGRPFDPTQQPSPPLGLPAEDTPVGGLGVYLMRRLAARIRYQRSGKYNILLLYCSNETASS